MRLRKAHASDVEALALLWHRGWQDAHARIIPDELARHRTLENFRNRLALALSTVRVAIADAGPAGFCMVRGDELYQLFVASEARGSGVAQALLEDGERRICASGAGLAWLACAIGNERAARFYEKHGWTRAGTMTSELPTPDGIFRLEVWRYEKDLDAGWPPAVGVAHVLLETDRMQDSAGFMRAIGMRPVFDGPEVSIYELRGGTHLILMRKDTVNTLDAGFDLMVDDLHAAHAHLTALGFAPSPIEPRPAIDHEVFTVREPAGHLVTFYSSHATGKPV